MACALPPQVDLTIHVFQLNEDGAADDDEGDDDGVPAYREWLLPCREFNGLWENLVYESDVKQRLLRFCRTALHFTDRCGRCGPARTRLRRVSACEPR